jgi:hypothetical protein
MALANIYGGPDMGEKKILWRNRDPSKLLDECELKMAKLTLRMTKTAMKLSRKRGKAPYII